MAKLTSSTTSVRKLDKVINDKYALYNGDCCEVVPELPEESVNFTLYSPPFSELFAYSNLLGDMGNCRSYEEFFTHYSFLVKALFRVTMPGRIVAVHCMDLPTFKRDGEEIGLNDFPGDIVRCHKEHGFIYHARFCIWKDPLIAATRTKAIGLAHKQIVKDSALCRTGIPDYILAFRKPGENPKPIQHKKGIRSYYGSKPIPANLEIYGSTEDQSKNKRSHWIWQQYASPVWTDIRQSKVLPHRDAKDPDDQKHVCPLQIDVIERCLELWSAPGDIVLDPFGGIGSTPYCAVRGGRKGIAVELKPSYFRQMVLNVKSAEKAQKTSLV